MRIRPIRPARWLIFALALGLPVLAVSPMAVAPALTPAFAAETPPNSDDAELARLVAALDDAIEFVDQPTARRLARRAINRYPESAVGWAGMGRYHVQRHEWADAEQMFAEALARDPQNYFANLGLGHVAEHARDYDAAARWIERARQIDPRRDGAVVAAARVRFKSQDMNGAVNLLWLAADMDKLSPSGHIYVGNGFVALENPVDAREIEAAGKPLAQETYRTAKTAYVSGHIQSAHDFALLAHQADPAYFGGPFILGLIARRNGDLDTAISWLTTASEIGRGHPLVHNALGIALSERKVRRYAASGWPEMAALRAALPTTLDVPGIDKLVPNYQALPDAAKQAILLAAAPWRKYIPRLVEKGVTHEILTLAESAVEARSRQWLRGRRTMDGRRYDDVRGMGGKAAVTSIEDIEAATDAMFNTFAHELTHQVHRMALGKSIEDDIDRLYAAAMAENRCLDYYAAHNADEYFAQGYEAFVSLFKRPCCGETGRHTRFELATKDPELFALLERLTEPDFFASENWDAAIEAAIKCLERAERLPESRAAKTWVAARFSARESAAEPQ